MLISYYRRLHIGISKLTIDKPIWRCGYRKRSPCDLMQGFTSSKVLQTYIILKDKQDISQNDDLWNMQSNTFGVLLMDVEGVSVRTEPVYCKPDVVQLFIPGVCIPQNLDQSNRPCLAEWGQVGRSEFFTGLRKACIYLLKPFWLKPLLTSRLLSKSDRTAP